MRMKRFVSYLYSIYHNQKIHNAGFARIELRAGRNRIDIHLRENRYTGKTGMVYLFVRNQENIQGISIGSITFRNNQADFRYEQPEENIGQTSWQIEQMNGIVILIDDQVAYLSQWDEQPVDTTRFAVLNQEQKNSYDNHKTNRLETDKYDREEISNEPKNTETREETGTTQPNHDSKVSIRNDEKDVEEKINDLRVVQDHGELTGNEPKKAETKEEIESSQSNHDHREVICDGQETKEEISRYLQSAQDHRENISDEQKNPDEQTHYLQSEKNMQEKEGNQDITKSSDIRTAEIQPQPGAPSWEQTWRYMLRMYPVMNQFSEKDHVLCVRIEIKDMRLLPEKCWSVINNSFLLHGFFNYRYLIFGKIDQNWFIGIPGIYQNQEHVMASVFGFPEFLPQARADERGRQPGYWYRILEI